MVGRVLSNGVTVATMKRRRKDEIQDAFSVSLGLNICAPCRSKKVTGFKACIPYVYDVRPYY
jgi:hypothetical protein